MTLINVDVILWRWFQNAGESLLPQPPSGNDGTDTYSQLFTSNKLSSRISDSKNRLSKESRTNTGKIHGGS